MVATLNEVFLAMSRTAGAASEILRRTEALPATVRLGHLGRLLASGSLSTTEFAAFVDVIEDALRRGDQQARDAVATGLVEAMVNAGGSASALGPLAQQYCSDLSAFFGQPRVAD